MAGRRLEFSDVRGHAAVRLSPEIAAAGNHNVLRLWAQQHE
jgi:predicted ATPase with chaperone activity